MGAHDPGHVVVEGFAPVDFDAFLSAHHAAIARALILSLRRAALAEEAALEGFGRALHQWASLHTHRHPEGWVFRTALDWSRRRVRHHPPLERPTAGAEPHPGFDGGLDRALGRLELTDRTIAVLRHYMAWPPADIAGALRLPRLVILWRLRSIHRALGRDAMIPPEEVATRLAWHLTAAAAAIEVGPPEVAAIRQPARRRGRGVAIGAALVAALVFGAIAWLNPGEDESPATTAVGDGGLAEAEPLNGEAPGDPSPVAALPGPSLVWKPAALPDDTAISHVVAADGRFVAFDGFLTPDAPIRRIWSSSDGITWSADDADLRPFLGGEVVYDIATHDTGLVAVGSVAVDDFGALGPIGPLVVWTSPDGERWRRTELQAATAPPPAPGLGWSPGFTVVAAGGRGIVVASRPTLAFDPASLPLGPVERALVAAGLRLRPGLDGFDLVDAYGLVAGRISYADLGTDAASVLEAGPGATLWYSPDGIEWKQAATLPPDLEQSFVGRVTATDDGFHATGVAQTGQPSSWFSANGLVWTADDAAAARGWTAWGVGALATIVDNTDAPWPTILLREPATDRQTLVTLDAGGLAAGAPLGVSGGPLGLLAHAVELDQVLSAPATVTIDRDGRRFALDLASGAATVTDLATGEVLRQVFTQMPGTTDDLPVDAATRTFSVLDPATGDVLFSAGWDEWTEAWQTALGPQAPPVTEAKARLWFTVDGRRWSAQTPGDVFGDPGFVGPTAVGVDRVVLVRQAGFGPARLPSGEIVGPQTLGVWVGSLDG